jgi:predicted DNA-binding transcriptional regulator AlpA
MNEQIFEKALVSPGEVQNLLNITRTTEIRHRKTGRLPKPVIVGRRVYYKRAELMQMLGL